MKLLISLLIMFMLCYLANGQEKYNVRKEIKKQLPALSLVFMAGAVDGLNQLITYHYKDFKRVFPSANDQYWYSPASFTNKYKNHDPKQGERFPGSKSIFVFTTDGYHLTRFVERLFLSGTFAITITSKRQKWYYYVIQGITFWGVNRLGFAAIFNTIK